MRHVARRVDVNEEADAGDDEDHDHGELVHLKIEAGAEVAGDDPVEEFFAEGLMGLLIVAEEFACSFERCGEGKARGRERDRVDDFVRPLQAEKTVDGRAKQRQQRNNPQVFENGLIGH